MEQVNLFDSNNNSEVREMLNKLYEIFLKKFKDMQKAWNHFLEFIAIDNSAGLIYEIGLNIEWLINDKRFRDSVFSVYDSNLLRSVYYDHLGDIYFELINKKTPKQILLNNIQTRIKTLSNEKKNSIGILDLNMGTGRKLMAIHGIDPKSILFGVTNDLNLFRIALTNSFLFEIKCYLLYADNKIHELGLDSKRGIDNWKQANQWNNSFNKLQQKLDKAGN